MAPPRGNRCRHCQPWAGSIAGHADRAVTPCLPAAGGKLPAAFRGFEAEAAGQGQAQRQPSGRYLQACAAPTGVDDVQGLTGVWLELEGLREMPGVETHAIGGCVHRRDCFRSEEHTSELQSLMSISYAVFCL